MKIILNKEEIAAACLAFVRKHAPDAPAAVATIKWDEANQKAIAEVDFDHPDLNRDDVPL
jgi:hypothetical protein